MSTRNKILAGLIVIFFVCLVVWVVKTTPTTPPPQEKIEPPTVMEYEGNTIVEEKDGIIFWELTCDKMLVDTITQNMELIGVRGKFYQHDEKDTVWNLTGARGVYYQNDKMVFVEGDVIVTNSEEAELHGDKLEWFSEEEKLIATGNVKIKNSDGAKLASDKVDWFVKEEKVTATGNVKVSREDMRGYGDFAIAMENFKKFGIMGHAKVLNGVSEDDDIFAQ